MLVFESATPMDTLKDVAVYLRQLASYHKKGMALTRTDKALNAARANALTLAAMDLEGAGIGKVASNVSVPHKFMNADTCAICGEYENNQLHKL